ncbi:phosphate transport system protein [Nitrosomonas marina]|uniref:Phosphate-specific transport system accessory protein PhoU n=1 Tax=Nitrosomonas marina TaxID=917 RepID=A0A1I0F7Y1_9PROT|nr:phosphate signaling complex protein PhoU [Nitrosomonas marina]SET53224.1 phosphate transport system protein [Nitrosomonas marina]
MPGRLEGHTIRRFDGELEQLHNEVLEMAELVFEQIRKALESFQQDNQQIIQAILERESQVDSLEKRIDNTITEVLAKRGPVARDLRAIMGFSKVVTDLERLGDEATRITHFSTRVHDNGPGRKNSDMLREIELVGDLACTVLREAIEVLRILDITRARKLLSQAGLDEEFNASLRRLTSFILEDALNMKYAINIILVLKSLERIDAHAHNLAEYVVYMVSGSDIRHSDNDQT